MHFMSIDNYLLLNPHLQVLALSNVDMRIEGVRSLSVTCGQHSSLRKIDFSSNNLRSEGLAEVAASIIEPSKTLRKVVLDNNEAKSIIAVLRAL